jgi:hypothetical protein
MAMITVIARWEDTQMPPEVEYQLWRQIKGAFEVDRIIFVPIAKGMENYHLEQYDTMEEALDAASTGRRVFLEPDGHYCIGGNIPQGDIVLITGNTNNNNKGYAKKEETYSITTPRRTHLYPTEAAAIALATRYGQ